MEWKLFTGRTSEFITKEWYSDREAAHHLEEDMHSERLLASVELIKEAIILGGTQVVDLGCGDGGLLSLLKEQNITAWGYDLTPNNINHATTVRKVDARYTDFKNDSEIVYADIAVLTEVLEHLVDPHSHLRGIPSKFLIASSPYNENHKRHYEFHLWAWDEDGYRALIEQAGYKILKHLKVSGWSQIILAIRE